MKIKLEKSNIKALWYVTSLLISTVIFILIWNFTENPDLVIWSLTGILTFQGVLFVLPAILIGQGKKGRK